MVTPSTQPMLSVVGFFVAFLVSVLLLWNLAVITPNAQSMPSLFNFTVFLAQARNNFVNVSLFQ